MKIAVIGGGISGLSAAHRLMELSRESGRTDEVRVLEASPRLGGIVSTRTGNGYLLEEGPDSFITDKPRALELCKRLGLEKDLIPTNAVRRSHVLWGGRLHPVPEGFHLMSPGKTSTLLGSSLFSMDGKARLLVERLVKPRKESGDESVASFVRRRLGPEALERLVQPLVSGIYGGDVEELSMRALFPRFADMENIHGSLAAARSAARDGEGEGTSGARYALFMSLKSGIGSLIEALSRALPQGCASVQASVQTIFRGGDRWELTLDTGHSLSVDGVVLALPAPRAAKLLRAVDGAAADALSAVRCAPSANVTFAWPRAAAQIPESFGFTVPGSLGKPLLGCTFSDAKFPGRAPEGAALLRAFIAPSFLDRDDDELVQAARETLAEVLGLKGEPLFSLVKRHAQAMPQYTVGHVDRIASLDLRLKAIPRFVLAGNALRGVGLPDCVKSAEDAAERLFAALSLIPARA